MTTLIQIVLIIALSFLVRNSKKTSSIQNHVFVLIGGLVTFLFGPLYNGQSADGAIDTGVQIASTIFGVYCILWSIVRMVKSTKKENPPISTTK